MQNDFDVLRLNHLYFPTWEIEEGKDMDGYESRYLDVKDWEVVAIGDEYYRLLRASGHMPDAASLSQEDLDQLVDVYHHWKILLGCQTPGLMEMDDLLHALHFDVIIELFCHRKLRQQQKLDWMI